MSRWVSKSAGFQFIARSDEVGYVTLPNGTTVPQPIKSALILDFKQVGEASLSPYERLVAYQHWSKKRVVNMGSPTGAPINNPWAGFGATPEPDSMPVAYDATGRATEWSVPYRPDMFFSVYDTDWLPESEREFADQQLRNYPLNGVEYIEVVPEQIPPPWPTYDKIDGRSAEKMVATCVDIGVNPNAVIAYEKAHKNRASFISALEKLLESQAKQRADDDALTVTVQ
jgi:hypothetical protein